MMKAKGKIITSAAVAVAAVLFLKSAYAVSEGNYAVITSFGKISNVVSEPGLYFKNPVSDSVKKISKKISLFDIPKTDVISADKKSLVADDYVLWRVTDPTKYMQTLGGVKSSAEDRVSVAAYNATKNTISGMTQDQVIEARGEKLTQLITAEANSDIGQYGIEIVEASIKSFDLPDDNRESVYNRMISERQNIAAGYTAKGNADAQKIRNETDKQAAITKANAEKTAAETIAEGEAEYMQKLSDAYSSPEKAEFYEYTRGLDALKESLKGSGEKTLILDKNSELAKILYGD